MEIKYLGHSSFLFTSEKGSRILIDPYSENISPEFPLETCDIVVITHEHNDHNAAWRLEGTPFIVKRTSSFITETEFPIPHTGELFTFKGIPSFHDGAKGKIKGPNTIYTFEMDGLSCCHLGDLGHLLDDTTIKLIGRVNILCMPVGGLTTINSAKAMILITKFMPAYVFPMHYNTETIDKFKLASESLDDYIRSIDSFDEINGDSFTILSTMVPRKPISIIFRS